MAFRGPLVTRILPTPVKIPDTSGNPNLLLGTLVGQETKVLANQYDWPNPERGRLFPIELRTWTNQRTTVGLTDVFFGLAGKPNYDQPNPTLPKLGKQDWAKSQRLGSDTFFGLAGKPTYDWANPNKVVTRGYLDTFQQSLALNNPSGVVASVVHWLTLLGVGS